MHMFLFLARDTRGGRFCSPNVSFRITFNSSGIQVGATSSREWAFLMYGGRLLWATWLSG